MFWNVEEKSVSKAKPFVKTSSVDVLSVLQSPACSGFVWELGSPHEGEGLILLLVSAGACLLLPSSVWAANISPLKLDFLHKKTKYMSDI